MLVFFQSLLLQEVLLLMFLLSLYADLFLLSGTSWCLRNIPCLILYLLRNEDLKLELGFGVIIFVKKW